MRALALALAALVLSCDPPTQHSVASYGTVRVWVDPADWDGDHRAEIATALRALAALGPAFVPAADAAGADVTVRHWASPGCDTHGAARWIVGSRAVDVDPVCTPGATAFRAAVGHEISHTLGMQHICQRPGDAPDCSPVGYGPALMAPGLVRGTDDGPGYGEAYAGAWVQDTPTDLDLAEFRRARGGE